MTEENPDDRVQSADDVVRELNAALKVVSESGDSHPKVPMKDQPQRETSARAKKQSTRATQPPSPRPTTHPPAAKSGHSERQSERIRPGRLPSYRRSWRIVAASVAAIAAVGVIIATMSEMIRPTIGTERTLIDADRPSSAMRNDREGASSQSAQRQPTQLGSTPPARPNNAPSLSATTTPAATVSPTPGSGRQVPGFHVLFIVPATDFYWPDAGPITRLLTESGCDVDMASWKSRATVLNNSGPAVAIPLLLTDVSPNDYDALIIGGGPGIVRLTESCEEADQAESVTKQMFASGKLVSAFNAGPGVLAKMKLLDNVKATGNPLLHQHVRDKYGVTLASSSVEISGRIITGRDNSSEVISEFVAGILRTLEARGDQP